MYGLTFASETVIFVSCLHSPGKWHLMGLISIKVTDQSVDNAQIVKMCGSNFAPESVRLNSCCHRPGKDMGWD